ncbi:MAG: RNA polymerase sigma factor RpoD/SigA [Elusimicrobiota bacterium]
MTPTLDSIKLYLKELSRISLISEEEMKKLVPRLRRKEKKARERMIKGNLRFVVSIAKRYYRPGVDLCDLIEAGNIGLIAAVNRYDPDRGTKFSTYAHDWIKEYIQRAVLSHTKPIHIPMYIYQKFQKIINAWDRVFKEKGRTATPEELAKFTGFPQKDVKKYLYYIKIFSEIPSLDAPISKGIDVPLKATIASTDTPSADDAAGVIAVHQQIEQLLVSITDREKEVIMLRFGIGATHPHTLHDVGVKLNISRERVRQIQDKAMNKLKKASVKMKGEDEL